MRVGVFLERTKNDGREPRPRLICVDGFSISVQAGEGLYCYPRDNHGPWLEVECGFPSKDPGRLLVSYAVDPTKNPKQTVYGYVPLETVQELIDEHGGIDGVVSCL